MTPAQIRQRLDEQGWRCAYPCSTERDDVGGPIHPGDDLAKAYDNHGLVHARCARIGVAPERRGHTIRDLYRDLTAACTCPDGLVDLECPTHRPRP
jgi:hypothetical protein